VHDLNDKLTREKTRVGELASMLEDPNNHPKKVDLEGEDPDTEALNAKI